jgi:hypothetical protein
MSSILSQANKFFRIGEYSQAIELYNLALQENPGLDSIIQFNIRIAQQRLSRDSAEKLTTLTLKKISSSWVKHEIIQNNTGCVLFVGGLGLGYPASVDNEIPQRVTDALQLFSMVAQIQILDRPCIRENGVKRLLVKTPSPSLNVLHIFDDLVLLSISICYVNSRDLRITVEKRINDNRSLVLRGYQYDPAVGGGLVLVGESLLQGKEIKLVDLFLINPYLPVLLILSSSEGHLIDASFIPYPSLLPGGIHEHECYVADESNHFDALSLARVWIVEHLRVLNSDSIWALGQLQVDIREATGAEIIFSSDFKVWLWSIFSLRIKAWAPPELNRITSEYWQEVFTTPSVINTLEKFSSQSFREKNGDLLVCPPLAIPSLSALTASQLFGGLVQKCGISNFIFVSNSPITQCWRINWPESVINFNNGLSHEDSIQIPFLATKKASEHEQVTARGVSAILFRDKISLNTLQTIMPVPPDYLNKYLEFERERQSSIVLIITVSDICYDVFSAFLESLLLQNNVNISNLIFVISDSEKTDGYRRYLNRYFCNKHSLVILDGEVTYVDRVEYAMSELKSQTNDYLLFVNQPIVMHDPRTLQTLINLLDIPKVVTTSAALVVNKNFKPNTKVSAQFLGFFSMKDSSQTESKLLLKNQHIPLPKLTLPVSSNGDAFFMIKFSEWKKSRGFEFVKYKDERAVIEYSVQLLENKLMHLLTQKVTVELHPNYCNYDAKNLCWDLSLDETKLKNTIQIEVLS